MNEQNKKRKKVDEHSTTLKASITENTNHFQRIENSMKMQAEKHTESV